MEYRNTELTIKDLIGLIERKEINLRPPYQRNFIWTPKDQRMLVDSINKGYPLPSFFILENNDGSLEMLDGQQRATTIFKYYHNEFKDTNRRYYADIDSERFLTYRLSVIMISNVDEANGESREEFFALVNKRGIHLNSAEVNQAQYHDSDFLQLVNRIMDIQQLIELDIFTDKTKLRMNDRGTIEEIVAYLFEDKIYDKRVEVDALFETKISEDKCQSVYNKFVLILDRISHLNAIKPLNETRYKQKNDLYTLFCFVNRHLDDSMDVLKYQYRILTFFSDEEFITPSNEDCEPFKEYALNCVSQSNSKKAREGRLNFFEDVLCNSSKDGNTTLMKVMEYFSIEYGGCSLKSVGKYLLINLEELA